MEEQPVLIFAQGFHKEPDLEKFSTCQHRSPTEETYTIKTCCQNKQETGWVCYQLRIYGLSPNHCRDCPAYQLHEDLVKNEQN